MSFKSKVAGGLSMLVLAGTALAQSQYPSKHIELIIPYAAGGATDVIGRMVASDLHDKLGQTIVAVNKPGAGTTVAANFVAQAEPDGYTLYMTTAAHTISDSLYRNLRYKPIEDFAPIHLVAKIPIVLVTGPSFGIKTLAEYIEQAKASERGFNVGSPGNGSPQHLTQALFQSRTGANFVHIPYRGDAPLITDLLGGQVGSAFITLSAALPHIQSGALVALAVANPTRIEAIKDVPTMTEAGLKDFNAATWFGLFGPAGIDPAIQQQIHTATKEIASTPEFVQRIESMGGQVVNLGPEEFSDYIREEARQWKSAVETSGAQVD